MSVQPFDAFVEAGSRQLNGRRVKGRAQLLGVAVRDKPPGAILRS